MTALSEWESKELLGTQLPRPREILSRSAAEADAFAADLGVPVVAKASGVAHKTEGGLVRVELEREALAACWGELATAGEGTVLVAEHIEADLELIVGGLRDPQFGPLVSVGLGGIFAEVLDDVAFVLAPPETGEVDRAIAGLRGAKLFDGYRGRSAPDRIQLNAIVDAVSDLLVTDEAVVEVDCNPILVRRGALFVADALVVRQA